MTGFNNWQLCYVSYFERDYTVAVYVLTNIFKIIKITI